MSTLFLKDVVSLTCPICKRPVRVVRIYAPSHPGLKQVGVKHGDHVVVIKFDKYGVARDINGYKLIETTAKAEKTVKCKRCGLSIPIIYGCGMTEYAVEHRDHFVIVFISGKFHFTQIIDKVPPVRVIPQISIISKINKEIGAKNLAMILYYALLGERREIYVPGTIKDTIYSLLKEIFGNVSIKLKEGPLMSIEWNEAAGYFLKKILYVSSYSDKEAIAVLKESIDFIENTKEALRKFLNRMGKEYVCSQIITLAQHDPPLFSLLQKLLGISCS